MELNQNFQIRTSEMHTGGEPLRIVESGYPDILGETILDKRRYAKENLDKFRTFLMTEPRGHFDMYGAVLVKPDIPEAHLAVLFLHNEGYSTMCGHAVIALGRYAIDRGIVSSPTSPETTVNIQCPCGLVRAFVEYSKEGKTGRVRFHSVPAFVFALDVEVDVDGFGLLKVDISYGGAFYAFVDGSKLGLDVRQSTTASIINAATRISNAVKQTVKLEHPESEDLAFLYGTIITDGQDQFSDKPTANVCVFADRQVDRCPTGSGVTARIALQYRKGLINLNQCRTFESGANGSLFTGSAVEQVTYGKHSAVIVEVSGKGHYSGQAVFTVENDDQLKHGFLLK